MKLAWTLSCGGSSDEWIEQTATPDGCVEIIYRQAGRSRWGEEQPNAFVAGIVTAPARFAMSGDAAFVGLRLWPWAWNALAAQGSATLVDRWRPLDQAAPDLPLFSTPDGAMAAMGPMLAGAPPDLAEAILKAAGMADLSRRSGRPARWLQRWFKREVGVAPHRYLRLLRFQEALTEMQRDPSPLADQAAAHGYADQAHMTREFRRLSGKPAGRARRSATGPFL
jgi:AraC-like DNA-binding protein